MKILVNRAIMKLKWYLFVQVYDYVMNIYCGKNQPASLNYFLHQLAMKSS